MDSGSLGYRALLSHRVLRSLLFAELVDTSGSWAFNTVFGAVLYLRTGSAVWIAIGLACKWLPALALGPFAGVLADRYDRARVMVASAAASAAVMTVLAIAVAIKAPLAVLLGLVVLQAVVGAAYGPAFSACLPEAVPEALLATANGMREVVNNTSVVLGPVVGSIFLVTGEPSIGVALNALSYLVPILIVTRLRLHSPGSAAPGGTVLGELADGLRALRAQPTALVLVIACALDTAVAGIGTSLALPISKHVGTGAEHYAYLLIATSVGSVVAAGVAGRLAASRRLSVVIVGALIVEALPYAVIVVFPHPVSAFLLLVVSGTGMIIVDILAVTALQRDVPRQFLGRIFGVFDTILFASVIVCTLAGGALTQAVGLSPVLLGVGLGVSALALAGTPTLRRMDRRTAERAAELEPIVSLLQQLDLFDHADRPALERTAISAEPVRLPAGSVVLREGEPAADLWLLKSGTLAVSAVGSASLPEITAPGYAGEIGLMQQRSRTATVTTGADCSLYRIPGQVFLDALAARTASPSLLLITGERLARTETRPAVR